MQDSVGQLNNNTIRNMQARNRATKEKLQTIRNNNMNSGYVRGVRMAKGTLTRTGDTVPQQEFTQPPPPSKQLSVLNVERRATGIGGLSETGGKVVTRDSNN